MTSDEIDAAFVDGMIRGVIAASSLDQVVKFPECATAEPTLRQMIRQYYIQGLQPDTDLALKTADRFIRALGDRVGGDIPDGGGPRHDAGMMRGGRGRRE